MTIRDIVVAFGFEVDKNSEKEAKDVVKGIKSFASQMLGAIGIGFSIAGISGLAEAAADAEALKSQFSQVFGDMENEAKERLETVADDTGINVNRMKASFSGIAAFAKVAGVEQAQALEISERAMIAVADSAAYYDRSIEDVTESLRSFLKGNYENDAALGLSATETTRNAAANELYRKSFKDLSEAEKQFTLLKMVEDANKASGAIGQAARESDTWTNQLGNLKQGLTDLRAASGSTILQPAVSVLKVLVFMTQKATKAVEGLTAENGILTRAGERYHALVKRLQPAADRLSQTLSKGMKKGSQAVRTVVDRLGGAENAFKILSIAAGAFLLVMSWRKVLSGAKAFVGMLSGIGKLFGMANLKVLGVVAVITLLALIVEDFIHFLKGNDSVIGTLFDKAGIGAENARQAVFNAWNKIKNFSVAIWNWLRSTAAQVFLALADVIKRHMSSISDSASKIWNGIMTILSVIWDNISGLAKAVFGGLLSFFDGWQLNLESVFEAIISAVDAVLRVFASIGDWISNHKGLMDAFVIVLGSIAAAFGIVKTAIAAYNIIAGICSTVSTVMAGGFGLASAAGGVLAGVIGFISSPVTITIAAIAALIAIGVLLYQNWETIKNYAIEIWNGIASFVSGMMSSIGDSMTGIKNTITNGFDEVATFIKELPAQAVQWGLDFMTGLKDGILKGVEGVVGAVKGVGERIRSFLHFSVPDEGPLTDYESWMPDFMSGLADGITSSEGIVLDRIRSLAGGIRTLMAAATANAATAAASTVNNTTSTVTQNVNIANSYSGGSAETQKNVSKAMKKSATDATTQMARGLAYARG